MAKDSIVPQETLNEIWKLKMDDMSMEDIIDRLRARTVPTGYPIHKWREGAAVHVGNWVV